MDLLALCINVLFMLKLSAIGFQIRRTAGTEVELQVEAAHTDGIMAFGTEMKLILNLRPGLLQGIRLLSMPLGTVDFFASFGGPSPEAP